MTAEPERRTEADGATSRPETSGRARTPAPPTALDRMVDGLSLGILVAGAVALAAGWDTIPDRVPHHFGLGGAPDRWGGRTMLVVLVGIGVALWFLLGSLKRLVPRGNFPVPLTAENAPEQFRLARALVGWLRLEVVAALAWIGWQSVRVARGRADGIGPWVVPVLVAAMLATTAIWWRASRRRARGP